jgi:membrane-associated phospholipid phosphatase
VRTIAAIGLAGSLLVAAPAEAGGRDTWDTASRVGEVALVAAALGASVGQEDWRGVKQLALTEAVTAGTTWGLKAIVEAERPDGSDDDSFPSGHTSISFAAAGFIGHRYGWDYGVPAVLVAAGVGVARIEANEHRWYDVVAGAAIGEGAALLFTRPFDADVAVVPFGDTKGGGLALAMRF